MRCGLAQGIEGRPADLVQGFLSRVALRELAGAKLLHKLLNFVGRGGCCGAQTHKHPQSQHHGKEASTGHGVCSWADKLPQTKYTPPHLCAVGWTIIIRDYHGSTRLGQVEPAGNHQFLGCTAGQPVSRRVNPAAHDEVEVNGNVLRFESPATSASERPAFKNQRQLFTPVHPLPVQPFTLRRFLRYMARARSARGCLSPGSYAAALL